MTSDRDAAEGSLTYILPLRCAESQVGGDLDEYVRWLAGRVETIVVDASPPAVFAEHARAWGAVVRHVAPLAELTEGAERSSHAASVVTGVRLARCERLVIAGHDVRYDDDGLRRVERALDNADVVRPQDYYDPMPWHAQWDTARMLINRAYRGDLPPTVGVRRSAMQRTGGYDGRAVFEQLELVRTVIASGGWDVLQRDLFVSRRPCTVRRFWTERLGQAYGEFGRPRRLAAQLALLPAAALAVVAFDWPALAVSAVAAVAVAEVGRRRDGGARVFPASTALFAPAWVAERAVFSWLAVAARISLGGLRPHAATSMRVLEDRHAPARKATSRQREKARRRRV